MSPTASETKPMRILRLEAEAFKRLRVVRIEPDGSTVEITGRNGQGKSSVLDAIEAAIGGGRHTPDKPIRRGHKKATVRLQLGDRAVELIVERTFTESGGSLKLTAPDGSEIKSPQALLDTLFGGLTFDPLAFTRMEPRQQVDVLKRVAGLDATLAKIEQDRAAAVAANTDARRVVGQLEAQLAGVPDVSGPDEETSVSALTADLLVAQERIRTIEDAKRNVAEGAKRVAALNARIAELQSSLDSAVKERDQTAAYVDQTNERLKTATAPDVEALKARIRTIETDNETARRRTLRRGLVERLHRARDEHATAQRAVEALNIDREEAVKAAKLPVPGLTFTDEGVALFGVPFDQASSAEQLRASVAMGLAMNPRLRVMLVREGSLLDADSRALLAAMAEQHDAQVWIEEVTNGEDVGIVIEDGQVRAAGSEGGAL